MIEQRTLKRMKFKALLSKVRLFCNRSKRSFIRILPPWKSRPFFKMQQLLFGRCKFQARKSDAIPTLSSHVGFTFSKDRSLEVFRLTRERPLALRLKTNLNSCSVTTCNFREHSLHVYKRTNHPKYFLITFFLFAAPLISRNYPWYIMLRWIARWREEDENFSTSFIFGIIFFCFYAIIETTQMYTTLNFVMTCIFEVVEEVTSFESGGWLHSWLMKREQLPGFMKV